MTWVVIILILFICAFFLITRVYVTKDKKTKETQQAMDESTYEPGEGDSGE